MRVNVKSMLDIEEQKTKLPVESNGKLPNDGWVKTGKNITYKLSKLSQNRPHVNFGNYGTEEIAACRTQRKKKYY